MYEWSKKITEKIEKSKCLDIKELRMVEISLRLYEIHNDVLDECLGVSENNKYELQYKM